MRKREHMISVVMTERQAKSVAMYLRLCDEHGAGRNAASSIRAVRVKIERSLKRRAACDGDSRTEAGR